MRLRERDPDPRVRRELEAIDAALRGEALGPEHDELAALASELVDARPAPSRDFAAELDAWAAEGFPEGLEPATRGGAASSQAARAPWLMRARRLARMRRPALAAASVLVVLVVAVTGLLRLSSQGPIAESDSGSSGSAVVPQAPGTSGDSSISSAPIEKQAAPGGAAPGSPAPRVQDLSSEIKLSTAENRVDDVTYDAAAVVTGHDGIVDAETVTSGEGRETRGRLEARVPTAELGPAMAEISDLASVESRDESLADITKAYNAAGNRFNHAQQRVTELVAALAGATDPGEIAGLKSQLRIARQRLAAARAELRHQKQHGNYARIAVTVVPKKAGFSIGSAAGDAVDVLEAIGGALLIALAVIVPLATVAAAIWLGARALRRRRRETVLDS